MLKAGPQLIEPQAFLNYLFVLANTWPADVLLLTVGVVSCQPAALVSRPLSFGYPVRGIVRHVHHAAASSDGQGPS